MRSVAVVLLYIVFNPTKEVIKPLKSVSIIDGNANYIIYIVVNS
jgi:hypothetical protein